MKTRYYTMLTGCLCAIYLFGCSASKEDVAEQKAEGTINAYPVSIDQAWEIGKKVFKWKDCDKLKEDKKSRYMIAEFESSFLVKTGCYVGVWFESLAADSTNVTVVSMKMSKIQYITSLSEEGFHDTFKKGVEFINAGKPLPEEDP